MESCMMKRIMYRHTCAVPSDKEDEKSDIGHAEMINQLDESSQKCKGIITDNEIIKTKKVIS